MEKYILWLNTIRDNSSEEYQARVPVATKDNIRDIANPILNYTPIKNEFLDGLVCKIAWTEVSENSWENRLKPLKKGTIPLGSDIEEIHVNPALDKGFDASATERLLSSAKPDVVVTYHRPNRKGYYEVTVSEDMLTTAFTNWQSFGEFYQYIVNSLKEGDELDEYIHMKQTVIDAVADGKMVTMDISYDDKQENNKNLSKALRTLGGLFAFKRKEFNGFNLANAEAIAAGTVNARLTHCPRNRQVILIRTDVLANMDVEVLADAMHMEKAEFLQRHVEVDDFGDSNILAVLCDEALFKFYDLKYKITDFKNGSNLTDKFFLHHWQTLSLSMYANAVAIRQAEDAA